MNEVQLVTFLKDMGVRRVVSSGDNVRGCCPIHGENNPSFGVSVYKDGHPWNCFACGESGLTIRSLCAKVWPDKSRQEIEHILSLYGGVSVVDTGEREHSDERISEHWYNAFPVCKELRDIDPDTLYAAGIRDYEADTVLVPYVVDGILSGCTAYIWNKNVDVKTYSLFGFKNRQHVFYPKMCRPNSSIILVEGVYDVLKVYDSGVDNVAAIGGTTITQSQRREIEAITDKTIVVMPDNDAGGETLVRSVTRAFPSHIIFVADGYGSSDPGEATYAGIQRALHSKRMLI